MSRRRRPLIVGLLAATAATAFAASPALAGWGPVLQPAASDSASKAALSVNGRGAVGAAWLQQYGRTVTVRSTAILPGRPAAVRTLRRARDRAMVGLTTVLDARGELTVAWVERASTNGLLHGPITVRAAFRTPAGRWSPVRMVSRASAFAFAEPRLAAATDGTVALVFNAGVRAAPEWASGRTAGRPFGRVGSVPTGRRGYLQEPRCPSTTPVACTSPALPAATLPSAAAASSSPRLNAAAASMPSVDRPRPRDSPALRPDRPWPRPRGLGRRRMQHDRGPQRTDPRDERRRRRRRDAEHRVGAGVEGADAERRAGGQRRAVLHAVRPDVAGRRGARRPPRAGRHGDPADGARRRLGRRHGGPRRQPAGDPGSPGRHRADRARGPARVGSRGRTRTAARSDVLRHRGCARRERAGGGAHGRSRAADHGVAPGGRRVGLVAVLEEPVIERVAHELGARREPQLLLDVRAVRLDGATR